MTATWNPHMARPDIDPEAYEQHLDDEAAEEAGLLPPLVPTPSETLEQLAATANREHGHVLIDDDNAAPHLLSALNHAICAGAALLQAQTLTPHGAWLNWCSAHLVIAQNTVNQYTRVAYYRDHVTACTSLKDAMRVLQRDGLLRPTTTPQYDADAIRALVKQGKSQREVARLVGCDRSRVAQLVNVDAYNAARRDRRARQVAEKAALKRQEQVKTFKASSLGDVHTKLLALSAALSAANMPGLDSRAKRILSQSLSDLYKIEDELKKALGFEHGS